MWVHPFPLQKPKSKMEMLGLDNAGLLNGMPCAAQNIETIYKVSSDALAVQLL